MLYHFFFAVLVVIIFIGTLRTNLVFGVRTSVSSLDSKLLPGKIQYIFFNVMFIFVMFAVSYRKLTHGDASGANLTCESIFSRCIIPFLHLLS